jgi:hypothetical protein
VRSRFSFCEYNDIHARSIKIHPYAKMALSIFTAVSKVRVLAQVKVYWYLLQLFYIKIIVNQVERDESMDSLVQIMNDTYKYVNAHDFLAAPGKDRVDILERLVLQTTECAYFIQENSNKKSFCTSGCFVGNAHGTHSN